MQSSRIKINDGKKIRQDWHLQRPSQLIVVTLIGRQSERDDWYFNRAR